MDHLVKLARALAESGLIKDDDFESQHPRTGTPLHHIVGQNPSNVAKQDLTLAWVLGKFGRDKIDDPGNIVWAPRLNTRRLTHTTTVKMKMIWDGVHVGK